ncbi:MAG TPA: glycosyltransferase [Devosiaceae bacterium]
MTEGELPYIGQALRSVLSQTLQCDIMLALPEVGRAFDVLEEQFPSVTIFRLPMMQVGLVRNVLINASNADWVAFLDGDDIWRREKIEKQLAFASARGVDFVGTDHTLLNEAGQVRAFSIGRNIPMPSTWFVRRSVMLARPFGGDRDGEDAEWWIENFAQVASARLSEFLIGYRVRKVSRSSLVKSKRNKLLAVRFAENPILRPLILISTWMINRLHKSDHYVWRARDWGYEPAART